jgi:hypothetical protein
MSLETKLAEEIEPINEYPNCNGCGTECEMIEFNKNRSCPCTQCLVKTMCHDMCEEWGEWYEYL